MHSIARTILASTVLFFTLVFAFSVQAATATVPGDVGVGFATTCKKFEGQLEEFSGGWCVHRPVRSSSQDVLYHFHGLGGSEFSWQNRWHYTDQIRQEWTKNRAPWPTVISISFGPIWLLAEKNESDFSGLYNALTAQVIPMIERELNLRPARRILLGESMGGFNTTQLALKWRGVSKAAILCAPMSLISPFSTPAEIQSHIETTWAWQYYRLKDPNTVIQGVTQAIELSKAFFPTPADWAKANPLVLAETPRIRPSLYVAIGSYDRYASYEANELFVQKLKRSAVNVEWRPQYGGHCSMDIPSLAQFLVQRER